MPKAPQLPLEEQVIDRDYSVFSKSSTCGTFCHRRAQRLRRNSVDKCKSNTEDLWGRRMHSPQPTSFAAKIRVRWYGKTLRRPAMVAAAEVYRIFYKKR